MNPRGDCGDDEPLSGYYFRETRFLRLLRFEIDGETPWLCEATSVAPAVLAFTHIHPEIAEHGGDGGASGDQVPTNKRGIPQRALAVRTSYVVESDGLSIVVSVTNHAKQSVSCELGWSLGADFADIQEADTGKREQTAEVDHEPNALGLTFTYRHDRLRYRARISVTTPAEWRVTGSRIATRLTFEPHDSIDLGLQVEPSAADGSSFGRDRDAHEQALKAWRDTFAHIRVPANRIAEATVASSIRDFASFPLLMGDADQWLALQAGMPLYPALFARDTLTAGWQAAWVDRGASLEASLTLLGSLQSDRVNDWRDEEPGRIPYQVRRGPLALLDINPYAAYYADYAGPLMFVIALGNLYAWTGDKAMVQRHWDTARRILDWARTDGDKNRDGYLEYQTRSSRGTMNQGWKDSGDAIVYEDGSPVPPPVGTCELQAYWFAAQQLMAVLSWAIGKGREARRYWRDASSLKKRFNRDWWIDDRACVALAFDPADRKVPAVSSNMGHCIAAGILSHEHLTAAVNRLFEPDMFSGWGIRTLSSEHNAYSPLSYHCGSVWAVEQATIAFGLRRFGFDARAQELARALFDLAQLYPESRIPECVGGYLRGGDASPGAYPRANTPQLWNATAFPLLVQTLLGLLPVAPLGVLMASPALPDWLPEVILNDVRVGHAVATLRFWRDGQGRSHVEVLEKRGTLRVIQQPPLESISAGLRDRLRALRETLIY